MKKKTLATKIGAVMLSSIMVMSMAACGNDSGSQGSSGSGSQAESGSQDSSEESSAASDESTQDSGEEASGDEGGEEASGGEEHESAGTVVLHEPKDLGGRTIKIGLWWDEYWDSNYQTLDDVTAAGGSYSNSETMQMKLDKIRDIESRWNCRIEWVNLGWDGITESINTSITAGTPDCDIYLADPQFGIPAALNGYAQKISSYAPADSDILNDQVVLRPFNVLGSNEYLMCTSDNYIIPSGACYMAYNAKMLDELNLEAPEALAEKGEWDWEKFAEYALACTRDTDGDGNMDTYGYGSVFTDTISAFLASNNAAIANSTTEGLSDSKTVEVFNFLDRLYNVDGSARPYQDDWNNDQLALFQGQVAFSIVRPYMLIDNAPNVDFDIRICPLPIGTSGDGTRMPVILVNSYFIPIGVEDAESVYLVFEEMQNWFDGDTYYRDDPEWFESAFVDLDQVDLAYQEGSKTGDDLWNSIPGLDVGAVFYGVYVNKDQTVSQAIESQKQIVQDGLDAAAAGIK